MDINTLTFLAKCYLKEFNYDNNDMVNQQRAFQLFIVSFSNLSHPLAKRSLVNLSFGIGPSRARLRLQYHLSHLAPVGSADLMSSLETEGLVLERQFFKIRRVSHVPTQHGDTKAEDEQYFEERILSLSLTMDQRLGTFYLIILGDKGANVDTGQPKAMAFNEMPEIKPHLDEVALGTVAGISHFLQALACLLETWHQGWNKTLDAIENIVGFHVSSSLENPPI